MVGLDDTIPLNIKSHWGAKMLRFRRRTIAVAVALISTILLPLTVGVGEAGAVESLEDRGVEVHIFSAGTTPVAAWVDGYVVTTAGVVMSHCGSTDFICQVFEINSQINQTITNFYVYLLDRRDDAVNTFVPYLMYVAGLYAQEGGDFMEATDYCTDLLDALDPSTAGNAAFCEVFAAFATLYEQEGQTTNLGGTVLNLLISYAMRSVNPSYCIIPNLVCPPPGAPI